MKNFDSDKFIKIYIRYMLDYKSADILEYFEKATTDSIDEEGIAYFYWGLAQDIDWLDDEIKILKCMAGESKDEIGFANIHDSSCKVLIHHAMLVYMCDTIYKLIDKFNSTPLDKSSIPCSLSSLIKLCVDKDKDIFKSIKKDLSKLQQSDSYKNIAKKLRVNNSHGVVKNKDGEIVEFEKLFNENIKDFDKVVEEINNIFNTLFAILSNGKTTRTQRCSLFPLPK